MSIDYSFKMFERLSDQIGGGPALKICAFFGASKALYIPTQASPEHVIAKLIGESAMADLCAAFGGQAMPLPALEVEGLKNAGRVFLMQNSGISQARMGALLGLTPRRVGQILQELKLQGLDDLAEFLAEIENELEGAQS